MTTSPGIEREALEAWTAANVPDLVPPLEWERLEGGHSNLTYQVQSRDGFRAVLRRPPLGPLQPRAHDMHREFRIISALWPTSVPVAQPYGYCQDPSVTGAHFYVMGLVEGRALATADDVRSWLPSGSMQRSAAYSYIDVMAALHVVDPDEVGLGDLARREDFVGRQLTSWYRSWTTSAADAGYDDPQVHEVHRLLQQHKPADGQVRIVHGDYGLHNCLVGADGRITAVLDWEVCTLGDPMFDLAYVINRWSVEGAAIPGRESLTMPSSFPSATEVITRYTSKTGNDLADLDYFIALNHWRSACIVQGVYTRYVRGQRPAEGVDLEGFRSSIGFRLEAASEAAAALG
jgi:aminoglycoside phosphotransferase (APT) family kinase protein